MSARIFILMVTLMALPGGCASSDEPNQRGVTPPARAAPLTPPATQMTSLTGTLRGGMMAIGGETTGWTLVGGGAVGGGAVGGGAVGTVELDVSKVQDEAKRLEGKRVNVKGRMIDKQYVERGTVRMMRVDGIEEAK